jgi:hypothetical protein
MLCIEKSKDGAFLQLRNLLPDQGNYLRSIAQIKEYLSALRGESRFGINSNKILGNIMWSIINSCGQNLYTIVFW